MTPTCCRAIATLTTVGYGDAVPVTTAGKLLSPLAMLSGLLVLAMPLGIIGENLMDTYRKSSLGRRSTQDPVILDKKTHLKFMKQRLKEAAKVRASLRGSVMAALDMAKDDPQCPRFGNAERHYISSFWLTLEAIEKSLNRGIGAKMIRALHRSRETTSHNPTSMHTAVLHVVLAHDLWVVR